MDRSEIEQGMMGLRDITTRAWWNIYQGCLSQGFDERQAFNLLQTYILGQNPNGSRPASDIGPRSDN